MTSPYLDNRFLIPSVFCWTILFVILFVDGLRHRSVRSRGWQLYASVVVVMGITLLFYWTLLFYKLASENESPIADVLYYFQAFFNDLSDSLFIGLILTIAAGFCITRDNFGPNRAKVFIVPTLYFITQLVFTYTAYAVRGTSEFEMNDAQVDVHDVYTPGQIFLLSLCLVANLVALLLSWVYTFDMLSIEVESLEAQFAQGQQGVERGRSEFLWAEEGVEGPQPKGPDDEDGAEPSSFADQIALRSKITLMKRFSWAVIVYVVALAAVELLPIIVIKAVELTVVIGHAAVTAMFMGGLGYIFRLREDSPYLMLTAGEDGTYELAMNGMSTALDVLESRSPSPSPRHPDALRSNGTAEIVPVPENSAPSAMQDLSAVEPHFSIADEEDYEDITGKPKSEPDMMARERDRLVDRKVKKEADGKND